MRPHRRQPTSFPCPWDSPGKSTGVGYHFLLQCIKVRSEREVTQSCPTPSDPMDCSPPGSSTHGIFQARVLEWGVIAFSGWVAETHLIQIFSIPRLKRLLGKWLQAKGKSVKKNSPTSRWLILNNETKSFTFYFSHYKSNMCACMHAKWTQSCLTPCEPMDCSPPGSSVHGILHARMLEWVAISFSRKCVCALVTEVGLDSTCNFVDCFLHLNWSSQTILRSLEFF